MPFNLGVTELIVIMLILLLVFGAKRLPEIGSSMGKGIREFKKSIREVKNSIDETPEEGVPPSRQLDAQNTAGEQQQQRSGEPKKLSE
ncbi:MAG: twin-arginine translocase TatA/TatE family subunit [Gemmatimonadota bacterium]|nr:MAG: twin-arginine translocase TatA/TatE family subunit [Gemmatimonadota bacterium]